MSASLPLGHIGVPYSGSISASGGTSPYKFAVVDGSLPLGLALDSSSGAITGIPTKWNDNYFWATATDAAGTVATLHGEITIRGKSPTSNVSVTVSPTSSSVGSGNTEQFAASVQGTSNTAVTWSATAGTVSSSGMFSAPRVATSTNVTVTATSAADSTKKSSATVNVIASTPALAITTSSLPGAQSGSAYSYPISATGGTTPYQWNIAAGSLPQGFTFNTAGQISGTTTQTGQFSFTAQVTDAANSTASQLFSLAVATTPPPPPPPPPGAGNYDGPAELPRVYMLTTTADTPAPGTTTLVNAGGNVQTALNNANCGDTIQLAAGVTFTGTITLPAKACDDLHWIILRTSAPDSILPPEGTRMTPCYAGVASLPGRPSFNCSSTQDVLATILDLQANSTGPIVLAPGANHYRLLGLEITRAVGTGIDYQLVSASGTADHLVLDRVWLHGTTQDDTKNGINLGGMTYAALIDSYATDFHCTAVTGGCTDAKVVGGGNSQYPGGPYKITGNFLEASGENILFGGGSATTTPADIEIRHNHFFKPLTWLPGQPGYVGGASGHPFMVKNLLELKNAQRVLIEGNIFEYSWAGFSQAGYLMLLTPKNQAGGCPICEVTDVTVRYNTFSHGGAGIAMADVPDDNGAVGTAGMRYSIHDVTIDDINRNLYQASSNSSSGTLFQVFSYWPNFALNSVSINHITGFPDPSSRMLSLSNSTAYPQMTGLSLTNSIIGAARYPVWSATGATSDCAISNVPLSSLNTCFRSYSFSQNALIANALSLSSWPAGNYFPATASAVGFSNYNGGNGGDYTLLSTSPYKNAASDGKDLGADISAIQNAIAGVY